MFNGHRGPRHHETVLLEDELRSLVSAGAITSDSQPSVHFVAIPSGVKQPGIRAYVQKPYCLLQLFAQTKDELYLRLAKISEKLTRFNSRFSSTGIQVGINDYDYHLCEQLFTSKVYYSQILFCAIPPGDNASSMEWTKFWEFCISSWWTELRDIISQ